MIQKSIRLFRLWGIPVELNLSWLFVLTLITWTFATRCYIPEIYPGRFLSYENWAVGFLTALLLFVSILLHEFSHALVASRNGLPIRKITLFMFGGVAHMEREVDNPTLELRMAAAGPLMTLLLAVLFHTVSFLSREMFYVSILFESLSRINVGVLIFNMVPGFPLDGGRILRAAIWRRTGNLQYATRIASRIGSGFAIVLIVMGFFLFIIYGQSISGLWLIFIGFFLKQAARSGYLMVAFKETLGHLHVSDIMRTGVVTTESSTSLRTLVDDYFLKYHFGSFPVMKDGEYVGIVTLKDVKRVEQDHWEKAAVEDVMDRSMAGLHLLPSDPAEKLFNLIVGMGIARVPVVDYSGNIIGIVTRRDLMEAIKVTTSIGQ